MAKPILLLDFDGVINALSWTAENPDTWSTWMVGTAEGYRIRWSPQVVDALKALHEKGLVEIRWLTTWAELAPTVLAPLIGLGADFDVAGSPRDPDVETSWWKFHFAKRIFEAEQRPIIWLDDDLKYEFDALDWVEEHGHLAVSPNDFLGLTPLALELIEDFARSKAEPVDA